MTQKQGSRLKQTTAQVMIYMWAVRLARPEYRRTKFSGEVVYNTHRVAIPNVAINEEFVAKLVGLTQRVGGDEPPIKVPSTKECRYCELTNSDCLERMNTIATGDPSLTDLF